MAISRKTAKPLCTQAEYALAEESFPPAIRTFELKEIRQRITRTRRLRDKYSDLYRKQSREILGKAAPTRRRMPTGNEATQIKRDFFAETLQRFEDRLGVMERKAEREQAKADKEKARRALEKALDRKQGSALPDGKKTRKASKGMRSVPSGKPEAFPNLQTMKGAARANHARAQAKRDNRGQDA